MAPHAEDLPTLDFSSFGNILNNEVKSTKATRHGIDPSTGTDLPEVPVATQADVDEAVKHARKAFKPWAKRSYDDRASLVLKLADAIEANSEIFKKWLIKESGKPAATSTIEVGMAVALLRGFTTLRLEPEVIEDSDDRRAVVRYVPLGVGAAIVPWNWPLVLAVGKIGPAMLTGNTLIMKPSPFTPYVGLKVGELAANIFPPGVLQVLSGGDDLGPMLTEHPDIDKVSFTGSSQTGKLVMKSCAATLKRVSLELGGNDAAIICDDIDIANVVPKIATFAFMSSGQICMDVKRIYVHANIYDKFRDAFVEHVKTIKTGPASDESVFVGPVQNKMQFGKVLDLYSEIAKQNWKVAYGGDPGESPSGYIIQPAVIDNPPEDSRIVTEEPFGPIVPLLKWTDEDDAIARANNTKMGLGASVWSKDIERGERIADQLEAGSVWINTHFELAPTVPFGGHKWSGLGMEWGTVGLKGWCNPQAMWLRKKM
jgi:acyl-CoA reductase-like NAD-dependent aldehyde dehydrogenase